MTRKRPAPIPPYVPRGPYVPPVLGPWVPPEPPWTDRHPVLTFAALVGYAVGLVLFWQVVGLVLPELGGWLHWATGGGPW